LNQGTEEREAKRREENAKKAKAAADQLFPGEKWQQEGEHIFISSRRKRGNFEEEFRDAEILRDSGSTVYLVPEIRSDRKRKYDAIVNGMMMEFKNVGGNANTLAAHFLKSRSQAPNVFINLETSSLTRREVMVALYSARNSVTHTDSHGNTIKGYSERNKHHSGRIILKLKGYKNLIYLNVDDLKASR
jgi:hypothetical protein